MLFNIAVIVVCIALDQVTKYLCVEHLVDVSTFPLIEDVLHLTYVENRGAAFGMLAEHRWVFMILSTVGIVGIFIWLVANRRDIVWNRVALSFIIGGGIGNMIDRIRLGYVIDFIDCRFIDFYVFNIADSFVCVGCAMYIIGIIYEEVRAYRAKKLARVEAGAQNGDSTHE